MSVLPTPYYQTELGTLYCGDCLEILPHLPKVSGIIADPPYGIDYQSTWRSDKGLWKPKIKNDIKPFILWLYQAFHEQKDKGCLLCFCRWDTEDIFKTTIELAGYEVKAQIIWDRIIHGMGDLGGTPAPQHDTIWFAVKGRYRLPRTRPKSVIRHKRISGDKLLHPNEKPISLYEDIIKSYFYPDWVILDLFVGSGTTAVACERLNRRWVGIEISKEYCQIAKDRLEKEVNQLKLFPVKEKVEPPKQGKLF